MYHSKSTEETMSELKSGVDGLDEVEATRRLKEYGYNEFGKGKKRTLVGLFISQFNNHLLILLIIAAVVAYLVGHKADALAIGIVVVLNVIFGVALEYGADRSMEELKKLTETKALVIRGGKKDLIDSRLLVPGDVIFLEEGMKVPADARLLEEHGLEVNEAPLTGESMPVKKNVGKVVLETPLAERSSMLFSGTFIVSGTAIAIVVATGTKTEMGSIERSLAEVSEEKTTLEKSLEKLGKIITIAAFVIVGLLFALGVWFGKYGMEDLFIYSVSVVVAAVPEGMLTILTLILAIGVKNMAKERAIVRKIQAVETLGNITFIATDKTGTITEGKMALVKVYDGKMKDFAELSGTEKILSYSYLCNSAHLTEEGVVGNETDRAFLIAGIAKGVNVRHFKQITKEIKFNPFDYVKKGMSGIYEIGKEKVVIVKGAPESVLDMCSQFEGRGKLDVKTKKEVLENLHALAREGMRVIGMAYGKPDRKGNVPNKGLTFLGLLALHDPIRREAKQTIEICKKAGIRVIMITGDNLATAQKIGHEIGLGEGKQVALWSELEKMDDSELDKALKNISVVARATPAAKLRIVERLVKQNEIVAMTGDGINDAPALKKAHVGVVLGRTGTAVSKEVADVVLTDDNFATLEKAVEYGRGIKDNIIKFLKFQITTNTALVFLSISYVFGIKLLEPIHILWINLIIDGPPALTLGIEKPRPEIMMEKPKKGTALIGPGFIMDVINMAAYMAVISMLLYAYYNATEPEKAITVVFTALVFMQLANVFNSRSYTEHFYTGIMENKWMVLALLATSLVQLLIVTDIGFEGIKTMFKTVTLSAPDFIIILVVFISVLVVGEAKKFFRKENENL